MGSGDASSYVESNYQILHLIWKLNRVEERLYQLNLRYGLFSSRLVYVHLFSGLPNRLEILWQLLKNTCQVDCNRRLYNLGEITVMLKDLEDDLNLRELLQAQRSIINYLNRQEEVYASLSGRWKELTNAMISIDTLIFSNPTLATRKREEVEKDLKELEGCLQKSSNLKVTPPQTRLLALSQTSGSF